MNRKDLISISDLSAAEISELIQEAIRLKQGKATASLGGKALALLFEKPSLRTRVSFEIAMYQLGGKALYLSPAEVGLGNRESVADVGRVLSRYAQCIAARTFNHSTVIDLAKSATIPVINALSDEEHPCQILADLLTIFEKKKRLKGLTLCYIGDGNNVASSLVLGASLTGLNFNIASPPGYEIKKSVWSLAEKFALESGAKLWQGTEIAVAARNADVVYTDVWTSMGQEKESAVRNAVFARYQVNPDVLKLAHTEVIFMHPLPAHHGQEISRGLLDSPGSVVFDQAENRLHIQKAILIKLLASHIEKR